MNLLITYTQDLYFRIIALINRCIPKRRQVLLSAFPDIEDQTIAVLRWLETERPDMDVIVLTRDTPLKVRPLLEQLLGKRTERVRVYSKHSLWGLWAYWRSKYVLFTHGLYGFLPVSKGQSVVNLWHGMPLKRIWRGLDGSFIPQCTWLLSTSAKFSTVQSLASGFPVDRIPVTGLPRNDLLFSSSTKTKLFKGEIGAGVNRVLFFLPTYRQSKVGFHTLDGRETDNALGMSVDEVAILDRTLATSDMRMLVKPHPMSVHAGRDMRLSDRIWIVSDQWLHERGVTLYEALAQVDALITDISSVYVDFLALRRPVFFFFPDLSEYRRTRTFLLEPIEEWLAGPLCTTVAELIAALEKFGMGNDEQEEKRRRFAEILNPQSKPDATARLFALLHI